MIRLNPSSHLCKLWILFSYVLVCWAGPSLSMPASTDDECSRCHGNKEIRRPNNSAPLLPVYFSTEWHMHEFKSVARPPFVSVSPKLTIHGVTHFDSSKKSMTEIYKDRCIDIFEKGREYPCQFLSVGRLTYLIKFSKSKPSEPISCCRWSDTPFFAPRRDVLQNMKYDQEMTFQGKKSKWLILDIPLPGPFGFGVYEDQTPAAFWFPVNSAWVQQEFYNFDPRRPNPEVFAVPAICRTQIPVCEK